MDHTLNQFSVVVVGQAHNPSILNPDFLIRSGIVKEEWGWRVENVLNTPPMAFVKYTEGVMITVEAEKLVAVDGRSEVDPCNSKIPELVSTYVGVLEHIRYTAIGLNFQSLIFGASPNEYLRAIFLRDEAWSQTEHEPKGYGLRFVYEIEDARVRLSLEVGEATRTGDSEKEPVIIAGGNFHRESDGVERAQEVLAATAKDWNKFQQLLREALMDTR